MIRNPSDGRPQTLTITMSGDPNDIHHFMWVLVRAGWDEKRDSARVYDNTMYLFPKDKPAHAASIDDHP